MTEADVEITLQRAKEAFPDARPRIITDNGPQFIAKDFKEFIRISGMTHVRTSHQRGREVSPFNLQYLSEELFSPGGLLLLSFDAVGGGMVLQKCDGNAPQPG